MYLSIQLMTTRAALSTLTLTICVRKAYALQVYILYIKHDEHTVDRKEDSSLVINCTNLVSDQWL